VVTRILEIQVILRNARHSTEANTFSLNIGEKKRKNPLSFTRTGKLETQKGITKNGRPAIYCFY